MSKINQIRKGALLGGSALMLVLASSSGAMAQCTGGAGLGPFLAPFLPLAAGGGATANSVISALTNTNTAYLTHTNAFIGSPPNPPPNSPGGGVWTRGIGGRMDVDSVGTINLSLPNLGLADSLTCQTTVRQEFAGYQAGVDIARLNAGNWNLHAGVTVGYVESDATDITPGGTFTGNFQTPFVGVYGAATYGGFFIDGQLRYDFYQNTINDAANGIQNQQFDARGWAFSTNAGYNHSLGNGWFIEPSAGLIISRTQVDPLNVAGTAVLGGGLGAPGTFQIHDIESFLARASLRVGTVIATQNVIFQPFATASVYHEFAPNVTSTATADFAPLFAALGVPLPPEFAAIGTFTSTLSTSRIGTYGQFAIGAAGQIVDTGWLGYARVDYRTGEDIEGWIVSGGIRYQFTPQQIAAVMSGKGIVTKAPAAPVVAPYNWNGFYIGGFAGTAWGYTDWRLPDGSHTEPKLAGVFGGGQVGYNFHMGNYLFGVEVDAGWTNANGASPCPNGFFVTCRNEADFIATAAGRVGLTWDRSLFYAKGGAAFMNATYQSVSNIPGFGVIQEAEETRTGWMAGLGLEFGLTPNWSLKAEYNYMDFGRDSITFPPNPGLGVLAITDEIDHNMHAVKVGVNYRLSGFAAPVVAKY